MIILSKFTTCCVILNCLTILIVVRSQGIPYNTSCNMFQTNMINFKSSGIIPATLVYTLSNPLTTGYQILEGIRSIYIFDLSGEYDFHVKTISKTNTDVTFSFSSLLITQISDFWIRIICYSYILQPYVFVGYASFPGPFPQTIFNQVITISSTTNFGGCKVQTYILGGHFYDIPFISILTTPINGAYVTPTNQFTVQITTMGNLAPYRLFQNIQFSYVVFQTSIIAIPNTKVQFNILLLQLPSGTLLNTFDFIASSDTYLNDLNLFYGISKIQLQAPIYTFGYMYSSTQFRLYYSNSRIVAFMLITAKLTNISSSGNCCGVHQFDWGSNICETCDTANISDTTPTPSTACPWMCTKCCISPWICYNCIGINVTLVNGACTNTRYCTSVALSTANGICQSCASPLTRKVNSPLNITCECPAKFYVFPTIPVANTPLSCLPCIFQCIVCFDAVSCIICNSPLFVMVTGGCTNITFCTSVVSTSTQSICSSCASGFRTASKNSLNDTCECITGYLNTTFMQCKPCVYQCVLCFNSSSCQQCSIGTNVTGGCTRVGGCIEVISSPTFSRCTKCDVGFRYNSISNKCECFPGFWLVTKLCTDVRGCLLVRKQGKINRCLGCDMIQLYVYDGIGNCSCTKGYQFNSIYTNCTQKCGDGRVFYIQCDDGNLEDGDGCSSKCKLQKGFRCVRGNDSYPTVCGIKLNKLSFDLYYTDRLSLQNKGQFIFKITSQPSVPIPTDVIKNLQFNCNKKHSIIQWSITDGFLKIVVGYQQDLQGIDAELQLSLDQKYVDSNYMQVPLQIKSNNIQLTYEQDTKSWNKLVPLIVIPLFGLSAIVGFFTHKLAGPEQVIASILMWVVFIFGKQKNVIMMPMEYLSYFNLNIYYLDMRKNNMYQSMPSRFRKDQLDASLLLNLNIFVISFVLLAIRHILLNQNIHIQKRIMKIMGISYHRIIFPISFSLFYLSLFGNQYYIIADNNSLFKYICLFTLIFLAFISFNQLFGCILDNKQPQGDSSWNGVSNCKKSYLPIFIIQTSITFLTVSCASLGLLDNISLYIQVSNILFLIYFCIQLPYDSNLDNLIQVLNILSVIYFSTWFTLRQKMTFLKSLQNELAIFNGFNLLMVIIIALSFVRYYQYLKKICQKYLKQQKNIISQQQKIQQQRQQRYIYNKTIINHNDFNLSNLNNNKNTKTTIDNVLLEKQIKNTRHQNNKLKKQEQLLRDFIQTQFTNNQ